MPDTCVLCACWVQAQKVSHNADSTGSQLLKALGAKVRGRGSKWVLKPAGTGPHTQTAVFKQSLLHHISPCTHTLSLLLSFVPFFLHVPCFAGLTAKCNAFNSPQTKCSPPAKQCACAQVLARDVLRPAVIIFTVKRSLADRGFLPSIHFARPAQLLQGAGSDGGGGRLEVCVKTVCRSL